MATNQKSKRAIEAVASKRGLLVRTWSPGDGMTRYAFFDKRDVVNVQDQTYFGPANPIHTAYGLKAAHAYVGRHGKVQAWRKRGQKRNYRSR